MIKQKTIVQIDNSFSTNIEISQEGNSVNLHYVDGEKETIVIEFGTNSMRAVKEPAEKLYALKQAETEKELEIIQNQLEDTCICESVF